jgi:outer membrane protein OmpA-like peptidoglycan-associated protein
MHGYPYRILLCWITLLVLIWLGLCSPWSLAWNIAVGCGAVFIIGSAWTLASRRIQAILLAARTVRYTMDTALPSLAAEVKHLTPLILLVTDNNDISRVSSVKDGTCAIDSVHITDTAIWVVISEPTHLTRAAVALKAWRAGQGPDGVAYLVAADRTGICDGSDVVHGARYTLATETKRWRYAIQASNRALGYSLPVCVGVFAEQVLTEHNRRPWGWISTDISAEKRGLDGIASIRSDQVDADLLFASLPSDITRFGHAASDAARQSYAHARSHWHALSSWARLHVMPELTDSDPGTPALQLAAFGVTTIAGRPNPKSPYRRYVASITALSQVIADDAMDTDATHPSHADNASRPAYVDKARHSLPVHPMPDPLILGLPKQRVPNALCRFLCDAYIALAVFFSAVAAASAWQNQALLHRVSDNITLYRALPSTLEKERLAAITTLKQDRDELERYARMGVPARLGLGFYHGDRLLPPLRELIAQYQPPAPPPAPAVLPITSLQINGLSLFKSGSAVLGPSAGQALVKALTMIQAYPSQRVLISGHSDNTGNAQSNLLLSQARAAAVRDWLVAASGLPLTHFIIHGFGTTRPLATNATVSGRAANRRVDIVLLPQEEDVAATFSPGAGFVPQP